MLKITNKIGKCSLCRNLQLKQAFEGQLKFLRISAQISAEYNSFERALRFSFINSNAYS